MATSIISTIVDSFTALTSGIAGAIVDTFNALFVGAEGGISNLAVWGLVIVAVGFGFGLLKKFTNIASK